MEVDNKHSEVKGTCPYAEVNLNARRDWFGTIVLWHDECLDLKQLHFIPGKKISTRVKTNLSQGVRLVSRWG